MVLYCTLMASSAEHGCERVCYIRIECECRACTIALLQCEPGVVVMRVEHCCTIEIDSHHACLMISVVEEAIYSGKTFTCSHVARHMATFYFLARLLHQRSCCSTHAHMPDGNGHIET